LASVDSLSDASLRSLARRIDPEILTNLGTAELRVRVETANGLLNDMSRSNDEYERTRLRLAAERILNAISLRAWLMGAQVLLGEIEKAKQDGAGTAHASALNELERFTRDNPQPGLQDAAVAAEISGINNNTSAPVRRRFGLWKVR
jgi:hypothetical protein